MEEKGKNIQEFKFEIEGIHFNEDLEQESESKQKPRIDLSQELEIHNNQKLGLEDLHEHYKDRA